jgi:hypothetical protein
LNIQNPGSLTWEKAIEPQDTTRTISSGWMLLPVTIGATTPAAVTTATVAEPSATRNNAAMDQARMMGVRRHRPHSRRYPPRPGPA